MLQSCELPYYVENSKELADLFAEEDKLRAWHFWAFFDRNECNVENIPEVEKNENLETISGDVSPCRK